MALTITYTVVPFLRSVQGRLHPGVPRHLSEREAAIAAAEYLAPFYAGAIVLKQRADAAQGTFLEPLVICMIGEVPDDVLRQTAA